MTGPAQETLPPPSDEAFQFYTEHYNQAIRRLSQAFSKELDAPESLLAEARAELDSFTAADCASVFGLGTPFSLAKEFYMDVICANAGAVARLLEKAGRAGEAKDFLFALYDAIRAAGFARGSDFLPNRLDSRTFMPMRRHVDEAYLHRVGFEHPDRVLLCVGDCQTMQLAERIRHGLPLRGIDMAAYQHGLGSLTSSPLGELLEPVGFVFFVNAAANYGVFTVPDYAVRRAEVLDETRALVDWLNSHRPCTSLFVTHVPFGVDNAVEQSGVPREVAMDAVTTFSDEIADILATAPSPALLRFTDYCPFSTGTEAFRDDPDHPAQLHIRLDIMEQIGTAATQVLAQATL